MVDLSFITSWAFLVPLFPALGFLVVGLGGPWLKRFEHGGWVAVGFSGLSMVVALLIGANELANPGTYVDRSYTWLQLSSPPGVGTFPNGFSLVMGTLVDPLSALMLLVVTVVGFLVMLYSIEYMHHDQGLPRYYAELSLFLTAMTGLVLSDNLLQFFLFWELVGVCSYFLIGFYYQKPSAASAAKEAFLVTRVGDVLFLLGIFIYFASFATSGGGGGWAASGFKFAAGNQPFLPVGSLPQTPLITVAGLCILGGAAGKSAQFPLDVWLPDAMEGPTTVSALIHAATMVAAGVYLLALTSIFIGFTPTDQLAIVAIGGFTTLWAASMAVVARDIKRVVAYSTVSQLGYMVLGVGAGFAMVGMFHLFTHAFFKALLFLSAGSVIHAVGTQDLFKMGGLRKKLPITSLAFAIGALSLSGIIPFAGFWSKDDLLSSVYSQLGTHPLYWPFFLCALVTVFLTAYYIFRAWFLAFSGEKTRDESIQHVHEGSWVMLVPLVVLSALATVAGFFVFDPSFQTLLPGVGIPPSYGTTDILLSVVSLGLGASGILVAWRLWGDGRVVTIPTTGPVAAAHTLLTNRYYVKDGVDLFGLKIVYGVARCADFVDVFVIDGTIRGIERLFTQLSNGLRRIQSGVVSDYAGYVAMGLAGFLALIVYIGPWLAKGWGG